MSNAQKDLPAYDYTNSDDKSDTMAETFVETGYDPTLRLKWGPTIFHNIWFSAQ